MRQGRNESSQRQPRMKKPIIGLAGGIGAGKTSVARILESLGAGVIDFDGLAHEVLCEPKIAAALRRWWGNSICSPDGTPDREAIASIVFCDSGELARLEALLYPRIRQRCRDLLADAESGARAMVLDAPKLYEAGLDKLCDAVIFVEANEATRIGRVARSKGWTKEELRRREKLQKPLDIKKASADHVVINQFGIGELRPQVERILSLVMASFA